MKLENAAQWLLVLIMLGVFINLYSLNQQLHSANEMAEQTQSYEKGISRAIGQQLPTSSVLATRLTDEHLSKLVMTTVNLALAKYNKKSTEQLSKENSLPTLAITSEQYLERQQRIEAITDSGYIDLEAVKQIQDAMKDMDRQQTEASLSKIFIALNEGRLSIEPGVIL